MGSEMCIRDRDWIADPDELMEVNRMKDLATPYRNGSLTQEDVRQLAAYLLELKPIAEDAVVETSSVGLAGGTAVERGAATFTGNCASCHSTGSDAIVGPGLSGVSTRGDDAYLRESIVDPGAVVVEGFPNVMPLGFDATLSSEEIDELIAYLKSL